MSQKSNSPSPSPSPSPATDPTREFVKGAAAGAHNTFANANEVGKRKGETLARKVLDHAVGIDEKGLDPAIALERIYAAADKLGVAPSASALDS